MKKSILLSALGFLALSLSVSWFAAYSQAIPYPAAFAPTFGQVTATSVFVDGGTAASSITYGGTFSGSVAQIGTAGSGDILIQGALGNGVSLYNQGTNMFACNVAGSGVCRSLFTLDTAGILNTVSPIVQDGNLTADAGYFAAVQIGAGTAITAQVLGNCTMATGTTCSVADTGVSATSTISCIASGATVATLASVTGVVVTAGTSYQVNANTANSDTWRCVRWN